ncbi:MAG: Ldh family oxidoreductase [Clostridiales bacterium]|nr:Ldh family oxidoreductase [Clostridiales bacterium]
MQYNTDKLKGFSAAVMQRAGLCAEDSRIFAESLINADMRGISSHGITRLSAYARRVQDGLVSPQSSLVVVQDGGSLLLIDAQNSMGAVSAYRAMELCMERAKENGCCFAAVRGGNHFGYAAYFTEHAASHGMIGVAVANSPAAIAPTGGAEPELGTNPVSIAIPAGKHRPLVLDMATSVVARGKVTLAKKEGRSIPADWGVDRHGLPTTDPAQVYAMLPFGGSKGYAISLIAEILCSCLSGALDGRTMGSFYDYSRTQQSGFFVGALNIGAILPAAEFTQRTDGLFDRIKASPPAADVQEIMIPGEIEANRYGQAEAEGIVLSDAILRELKTLAQTYQVPFDCRQSDSDN